VNPAIRDAIPDIERVYDDYARALDALQREQKEQLIQSMPLVDPTWYIFEDYVPAQQQYSPETRRTSKEELSGTLLLEISQLRIESPMELTLAAVQAVGHGGGVMAAVIYGVHLLVKVMRDPQRVGAALPRLMAGWHEGMTELEQARQEREEAERERARQAAISSADIRLVRAAETIKELPTTEVAALDAGEPPEDIVAAFTD
jgi:hypothetical protein